MVPAVIDRSAIVTCPNTGNRTPSPRVYKQSPVVDEGASALKNPFLYSLLSLALLPVLTSCGGTNHPYIDPPPSSGSTVTAVSASCTPATIAVNATSQCSATVQGTGGYSSAVSWTVKGGGSINTQGVFTAPASAATITVTATSLQSTTLSGATTIKVQTTAPAAPQVPQSQHVVLVMEENQSYSTVVGATSVWPNLNTLIAQGALPTNYYADSHPSIGNYFMLTTGQLLTTDDSSTQVFNVDNIARRMLASGVSFRIYAEGITQGYVGGDTGAYLIRHNPFAMLSDVASDQQVAN